MANTTELHGNVGWVSGPRTCGTAGLLFGCLSTIILCTWSAVHLRVPKGQHLEVRDFIRKLRWVGIAIIAPECIPYLAISEWNMARSVDRSVSSYKVIHRVYSGQPLSLAR
ncbi:hypothetical protein K469DRAFT_656304 [Zopfia rhizophila CBS 207.26]|uniref:Uncharacterized protein n=1 Tax=Zopfia rhizophila CBS 207.26 TaxID=1314779 RepID=A0A6A6EJ66_9PEZI|nr:hypothetical protein K469DRAFT_656304 [Zopfia rhizophila CBS 207.26]